MYNDKEEYDGFPLIPVIFNIVHKSYEIMKVIKRGKNIKYKESKNHHNIFDGACKELFGDNVYHTWCELIFHLILTFVSIWHYGFNNLEIQFKVAK